MKSFSNLLAFAPLAGMVGIALAVFPAVFPFAQSANGAEKVLFDGSSLEQAWELQQPGGWIVEEDGSMVCVLKDGRDRKGKPRKVGMGYIWSKKDFGDFELTLSYKLSERANSGVFVRANPSNPVQEGIEVQLLDETGVETDAETKVRRNMNTAIYDAQGPSKDAAKPVGEWNRLRIVCRGPKIEVELNGEIVNEANLDDWDSAGTNPDGSPNKYKKALRDFPRKGRIGFQNHGHVVWFRDVRIRELASE